MPLLLKKKSKQVSTAAQITGGIKQVTGISLLRRINLIEFIQNPYNDSQLQSFEAATRRNWAVKSGISVREFFAFSKGSEIILDLPESKKEGLTKEILVRLLHNSPPKLQVAILICCSSGMRLGELVQLRISDVNFGTTPTTIKIRNRLKGIYKLLNTVAQKEGFTPNTDVYTNQELIDRKIN